MHLFCFKNRRNEIIPFECWASRQTSSGTTLFFKRPLIFSKRKSVWQHFISKAFNGKKILYECFGIIVFITFTRWRCQSILTIQWIRLPPPPFQSEFLSIDFKTDVKNDNNTKRRESNSKNVKYRSESMPVVRFLGLVSFLMSSTENLHASRVIASNKKLFFIKTAECRCIFKSMPSSLYVKVKLFIITYRSHFAKIEYGLLLLMKHILALLIQWWQIAVFDQAIQSYHACPRFSYKLSFFEQILRPIDKRQLNQRYGQDQALYAFVGDINSLSLMILLKYFWNCNDKIYLSFSSYVYTSYRHHREMRQIL